MRETESVHSPIPCPMGPHPFGTHAPCPVLASSLMLTCLDDDVPAPAPEPVPEGPGAADVRQGSLGVDAVAVAHAGLYREEKVVCLLGVCGADAGGEQPLPEEEEEGAVEAG